MGKRETWKNRSAIIMGASETLGNILSTRLASLGVSLWIVDSNPDRAARLAAEIRCRGGGAESWSADIANRFQVSAMIENARDWLGQISLFINLTDLAPEREWLTLDEWEWRRLVDVNLTGAFFGTQLISRVMMDEGGGVIVHGHDAVTAAKNPATAATRAAIPEFADYVNQRLRDRGVHVLSLAKKADENAEAYVDRLIERCYSLLV